MVRERWTELLSKAYEKLYHQLEGNHHAVIDPYVTEYPAEFFAMLTEVFFEQPMLLHSLYPDVYEQLRMFYRQDPAQRISIHSH